MSRGIDYAGPYATCNRNLATGIRYGIIPQNDILEVWGEQSEPEYGDPCCPKCGNEAVAPADLPDQDDDGKDIDTDDDTWTRAEHECDDFACLSCRYVFGSESAYGDDPCSFTYEGDGIKAFSDSNGDVWITESPYYTRAQFCSPCAPGACYLESPCEDGEKAYCPPHSWFDEDEAPYPVFRVKDDSMVMAERRPCPICGARVTLQNETTADGRYIGTCGDAFTLEQWDSLYHPADDEEILS